MCIAFDRLTLRTAATDGARLVLELAVSPDLFSALKQSALGILSKSCQTEKKENVTQEIGFFPVGESLNIINSIEFPRPPERCMKISMCRGDDKYYTRKRAPQKIVHVYSLTNAILLLKHHVPLTRLIETRKNPFFAHWLHAPTRLQTYPHSLFLLSFFPMKLKEDQTKNFSQKTGDFFGEWGKCEWVKRVEKAGQMKRMFKGARFPLRLLKVLMSPQTGRRRMIHSRRWLSWQWTTALAPASWPAHNCRGPVDSRTSAFVTALTDLPTIRRTTSQIPKRGAPRFCLKESTGRLERRPSLLDRLRYSKDSLTTSNYW